MSTSMAPSAEAGVPPEIAAMHSALRRRQQQVETDTEQALLVARRAREASPLPPVPVPASTHTSAHAEAVAPSDMSVRSASLRAPSLIERRPSTADRSPLPDQASVPWGVLTPAEVEYESYVSATLAGDAPVPSLLFLRSLLVRCFPQLGTRAMVGLQGGGAGGAVASSPSAQPLPAGVVASPLGLSIDEDQLPLSLWRAEEPGSAAGDSVGALFPPDQFGHVPSTAAALYAQTEMYSQQRGEELYGPFWPGIQAEADDRVRGYPLSDKQRRRIQDKLTQREKDLVLEATSKQDRAEVLLTIYTEQREGVWKVRRAVEVGSDDQIAMETPHAMDPWSVPIDARGILARNKLRSMIELSATRMNVLCTCLSRPEGPVGSDGEEDEPAQASACSICHGCQAVEMSFVITVTLRVAAFLPLALPCMHIAGQREPHLRYDEDMQREDAVRRLAVEGALNASVRVGRQHHTQHGARLLLASAVVRRTRGVSLQVHSHKARSARTFDFVDAFPSLPAPSGGDPASPAYARQWPSLLDTSPPIARARAQAFLASPAASPLSSSGGGGSGGYFPRSRGSSLRSMGSGRPASPSLSSAPGLAPPPAPQGGGASPRRGFRDLFR